MPMPAYFEISSDSREP